MFFIGVFREASVVITDARFAVTNQGEMHFNIISPWAMGSESVIIDQSDSWTLMLIPFGVSTIVGNMLDDCPLVDKRVVCWIRHDGIA